MMVKHWNTLPRQAVDVPGSVQGKFGRGPEHPGLVEGAPAQARGVGTG